MPELLKVVIIGDGGVGKTSIRNQYIHKRFAKTYKATIGADFISKQLQVGGRSVALQIWDTAGQERFKSLTAAYYRGADCCILVYDVCNPQSLKNIKTWVPQFVIQAKLSKPESFYFILLANKIDSPNRVISTEQGLEALSELKTQLYDLSTDCYKCNAPRSFSRHQSSSSIDKTSKIPRESHELQVADIPVGIQTSTPLLKSKETLKQEFVHSSSYQDTMYSFNTPTSDISDILAASTDPKEESTVHYFESSAINGSGIDQVFDFIASYVYSMPKSNSMPNITYPQILESHPKTNCNC
jgi:small GTP-binding protein